MQRHVLCLLTLPSVLLTARAAGAADYYASPSGSGSTCSQASPCSAGTAAGKTNPGDTVHLADGTYNTSLLPTRSGNATAWITYAAADGAVPIFMGPGNDTLSTGVGTSSASYIRFVGLVAQNWGSGFANGWTGSGTTNSNGNLQFINCIADEDWDNGIALHSAQGFLVQQCIVAHTGFQHRPLLVERRRHVRRRRVRASANVVEQTVAFENMDNQQHTDGSGFISDDNGTGVSFINNICFRNGGSCIRLTTTTSSATNAHIINNTSYGDGLDPAATGPSTPDEIFFSSAATAGGVVMVNNLAVATGTGGDTAAIFVLGTPQQNSNNYTLNNGSTAFWAGRDRDQPRLPPA